ncbi:MAG: hypothetical protein IJW47_02100, partial [Clostridia bacterium]|nr:hypothetical protein [Clostridia bacterium]
IIGGVLTFIPNVQSSSVIAEGNLKVSSGYYADTTFEVKESGYYSIYYSNASIYAVASANGVARNGTDGSEESYVANGTSYDNQQIYYLLKGKYTVTFRSSGNIIKYCVLKD